MLHSCGLSAQHLPGSKSSDAMTRNPQNVDHLLMPPRFIVRLTDCCAAGLRAGRDGRCSAAGQVIDAVMDMLGSLLVIDDDGPHPLARGSAGAQVECSKTLRACEARGFIWSSAQP